MPGIEHENHFKFTCDRKKLSLVCRGVDLQYARTYISLVWAGSPQNLALPTEPPVISRSSVKVPE